MKKLLAITFVSLLAVACGGNAPEAAHPNPPNAGATKKEIKAPGEAKVGDTSKCPVSGEEFVVSENSPKVEHEGKTYYFCCSGCEKKFKADPKKFLNKT